MRLWKGKAGFILVELIIATAILAAVIPLSKFFIDTIKATRETKIQQTANHLAQTYMEEYKGKNLEVIKDIPDGGQDFDCGNYKVSVAKEPFIVSSDSENCLGSIKITKESTSGIKLKLISAKADGGEITSTAISEIDNYTLELSNTGITLLKNNEYIGSVVISLPEGDEKPELDLFVEKNPKLTLNIKNNLDKKLIINKIALDSEPNSDFKLVIKQGKVGVRDNANIEDYQHGAHIIVTVKDKDGEILAEVAQTRLIEWAKSKE